MIEGVRINCFGISNGFRTPLSQSVQDTLPLPAPTQLLGLLGAAAGISRLSMPEMYSKFRVGVIGTSQAMYQDLTKIVKYAANGMVKNPENPISLLMRENLFNSEFTIWYIPNGDIDVTHVADFFRNPKFALSLGRDDEIIRIDQVSVVHLKEIEEAVIHETIVPFAVDPEYEKVIDVNGVMVPLIPISLPRAFSVDNRNVRTPIDFKDYTFIEGYTIHTKRIGALNDGEKQFFPL